VVKTLESFKRFENSEKQLHITCICWQ